jgi:hypothetical protein
MMVHLLGEVMEPFLLMTSCPSLRMLHMRWDIVLDDDVTLACTTYDELTPFL